jgi:hypothetical protein
MRGKLTEALTDINKYQAERIARTEINGAAIPDHLKGLANGVALGKEWINIRVERDQGEPPVLRVPGECENGLSI